MIPAPRQRGLWWRWVWPQPPPSSVPAGSQASAPWQKKPFYHFADPAGISAPPAVFPPGHQQNTLHWELMLRTCGAISKAAPSVRGSSAAFELLLRWLPTCSCFESKVALISVDFLNTTSWFWLIAIMFLQWMEINQAQSAPFCFQCGLYTPKSQVIIFTRGQNQCHTLTSGAASVIWAGEFRRCDRALISTW